MLARITGTGHYLPPRLETAEEVGARLGVGAGWVLEHTGVANRRVAEEPIERMAAKAAERALGDGPPPDLVIFAAATQRQAVPDTSVFVQAELGLSGIPSHSVHATCLSFLVALHQAACLVAAGAYRRVLVVSSEIATTSRDWTEPESASLFGDGAGAAVVEPGLAGGPSFLAYRMRTYPEHRALAEFRGGGTRHHPGDPSSTPEHHVFRMDGPALYRVARRRVLALLRELLSAAGVSLDEIDLVVPHQPSGPGLAALGRYGFSREKVVDVVAEYGNCVAASLPIALSVAAETGRLMPGRRVLLLGTGAGLGVAGAVLRW